ncbi:MAG TPA: hypothetical protein VK545_14340 [Streptomyces sp.]|nr:hypothetical protein [Streptomyces sp.]
MLPCAPARSYAGHSLTGGRPGSLGHHCGAMMGGLLGAAAAAVLGVAVLGDLPAASWCGLAVPGLGLALPTRRGASGRMDP